MTQRFTVVREGRPVTRKPPKIVPREHYLSYLEAHGPTTLEVIADRLDVSLSTAKRRLDGLVLRNKATVERKRTKRADIYAIPEKEN
jgi:predicted ArsR family transcriptional regulator